jgi:hypothetical protein
MGYANNGPSAAPKAKPNKPKQSQSDPHFSLTRGTQNQNKPKQTQSQTQRLSKLFLSLTLTFTLTCAIVSGEAGRNIGGNLCNVPHRDFRKGGTS